MVRRNLIVSGVVLILLVLLLVPQIADAQTITTHSYAENPGIAGEENSISFTIHNELNQQIYMKSATVNWEWRTTPYTWTGSTAIASGESRTVTVNFDIPDNAATTTQQGEVVFTYSIGSESATPQTVTIEPLTDFSVEPATDLWFYFTIIIVLATVIIVVSIIYLYVKKKPLVNVYKETKQIQAEKEDPKTRIRAPAQRGGAATQVVGAGDATKVTTPGGGLELVFPKGSKKIVTNEMVISRQDFGNILDPSVLQRISKNHLRIYKQGNDFYIEDGYRGKSSTNGTKLNGKEIRGAGPQQITTASTVSLADVADIQLTIK